MSSSTQTGKAKRPDVTARKNLHKNLVEPYVKCALPGRLAPDWPPIVRDVFNDNLERQILSTPEIVVRGSLLVNEVLPHYLRHEFPFSALPLLQCLLPPKPEGRG